MTGDLIERAARGARSAASWVDCVKQDLQEAQEALASAMQDLALAEQIKVRAEAGALTEDDMRHLPPSLSDMSSPMNVVINEALRMLRPSAFAAFDLKDLQVPASVFDTAGKTITIRRPPAYAYRGSKVVPGAGE